MDGILWAGDGTLSDAQAIAKEVMTLLHKEGLLQQIQPKALAPADAAVYLGLSVATLERMRASGNGPPFVKIGKSVRYARDAMDEWLREDAVRSSAEAEVLRGR